MSTQMMQPTPTLQKEVKAEKKISLAKVMVLTDFSEVSDLALQYAMALARRYDARVYLTHILDNRNIFKYLSRRPFQNASDFGYCPL